jgi:hypothetical protein
MQRVIAGSAYVSIRQHTSACVSIRQHACACVSIREHTSAYVSTRQHTSAYVSIREHPSAYVTLMRWLSCLCLTIKRVIAGSQQQPATTSVLSSGLFFKKKV